MSIEKSLRKIGIQPLEEITREEKHNIIKNVAKSIISTFSYHKTDYCQMVNKMYNCKMSRAKIQEGLERVNYFYKNKTIYFDETLDLSKIDENITRECIHYIQNGNNQELERMGLCVFEKFKVRGMALNEVAINFIVNKIFGKRESSKTQVLLKQMCLITGEDVLVDSSINNNENFEEKFMEQTKTDILYFQIESNLDKMFDIEQKISKLMSEGRKSKNLKRIFKKVNIHKKELNQIFLETQWEIFSTYFNRKIQVINTLEQVENYKNELFDYNQWLEISIDDEIKYSLFSAEKIEKLERKEIEIIRRNSSTGLILFNNNPIFSIIRSIRKLIFSKPEDYEVGKQEK